MTGQATAPGEWATLGDYVEVVHGCSAGPSADPTSLRVLKISAATRGYFRPEENKFIEDLPEYRRRFGLQQGDVLLCRTNGTLAYVGMSALVPDDQPDTIFPDKLMRARMIRPGLHPEYLSRLLQLPAMRAHIEAAARTAVGNYAIGSSDVEALSILLPSLEQQEATIDMLEAAHTSANAMRAEVERIRTEATGAFAAALFGEAG